MITPELKDKVLSSIVSANEIKLDILFKEWVKELDIKPDVLIAILKYFERIGIIDELNFTLGLDTCFFTVTVEAFDLNRLGGFTGKEEILNLEFDKLKLEIESLKKSNPALADNMLNRLANIAGIIDFISKFSS